MCDEFAQVLEHTWEPAHEKEREAAAVESMPLWPMKLHAKRAEDDEDDEPQMGSAVGFNLSTIVLFDQYYCCWVRWGLWRGCQGGMGREEIKSGRRRTTHCLGVNSCLWPYKPPLLRQAVAATWDETLEIMYTTLKSLLGCFITLSLHSRGTATLLNIIALTFLFFLFISTKSREWFLCSWNCSFISFLFSFFAPFCVPCYFDFNFHFRVSSQASATRDTYNKFLIRFIIIPISSNLLLHVLEAFFFMLAWKPKAALDWSQGGSCFDAFCYMLLLVAWGFPIMRWNSSARIHGFWFVNKLSDDDMASNIFHDWNSKRGKRTRVEIENSIKKNQQTH